MNVCLDSGSRRKRGRKRVVGMDGEAILDLMEQSGGEGCVCAISNGV